MTAPALFDDLATCRVCNGGFVRRNSMQTVCSMRCAIKLPAINRRAQIEDRRQTKRKLDALKSRSEWLKDAQVVINRYVRLRDANLGCVSCDKPPSWSGQWHASHFRSVGSASSVRFNLWNIHKSCSVCNNWKSGNLSEYEPRLRARIGDERVDALIASNERSSYSVEYLKRLKAVFMKKAARIERRNK